MENLSDKKDRENLYNALKELGWNDSQILKLLLYIDTSDKSFINELKNLFNIK